MSHDGRLTVVRPSFDCRSKLLKYITVLVLLLTVGVGNVWGATATWTKVTSAPSDWSGEYLIVNETNSVAYNGSLTSGIDSNTGQSVTISGGSISLDDSYSATLTKLNDGKYSLKLASGYYIGRNANSNGTDNSTTWSDNYKITITFNSTTKIVSLAGNGGRCLAFLTDNNNPRWRFFASSNANVTLYQKASSCSSPATALSVSASATTIYASIGTSTLSTTGGNGSSVTYTVTSDNSAYATISGTTFSATRAGTYTIQASQDEDGGVCGGTSTVNITVRYRVKWSVNGDDTYSTGSPTTYIGTHNTKVTTLPTAPGSALCDGSKVFVGWTTGEYSHASTAPATLFTTASAAPNVTGNVTYYAVFANTGTSTASDVINRALVVGANSSIGSNNNSTWANATVTGSSSGAKYLIRSMGLNSATTYAIRWNSNGYLYTSTAPSSGYTLKSVTIQTLGSDKSVAIYGATSKYSAAATSTQLSSSFSATTSGSIYSLTSAQLANNYTCIGINGTESSTQIVSITITYNTTSYSNYATTCCTKLGSINGSIFLSKGKRTDSPKQNQTQDNSYVWQKIG